MSYIQKFLNDSKLSNLCPKCSIKRFFMYKCKHFSWCYIFLICTLYIYIYNFYLMWWSVICCFILYMYEDELGRVYSWKEQHHWVNSSNLCLVGLTFFVLTLTLFWRNSCTYLAVVRCTVINLWWTCRSKYHDSLFR